jgi:hypothetical protein
MNSSVGFGNEPGQIGFTPASTDQAADVGKEGTVLRVDQGPKDQISEGGGKAAQPLVYDTTSQYPKLTKPEPPKGTQTSQGQDADKASKELGGDTSVFVESQDSGTIEQEPPERDQREDQGDGGGQQGSDSGSHTGGGSGQQGAFDSDSRAAILAQGSQGTEGNDQDKATVPKPKVIRADASTGLTDTPSSTQVSDAQAQGTAKISSTTPVTLAAGQIYDPPENIGQFYQNTATLLDEMYKAQAKIVDSMPDGPDKIRYADFLAKVHEALLEFQQFLNSLQTEDSKGARTLSQAQLEAALDKLKKQEEERQRLEDMSKEQREKEGKLGPLTKTMGITGIVMTSAAILAAPLLMAAFPLGPIFLSIMILSLVAQCQQMSGEENTAWKDMFKGFDFICEEFTKNVMAPMVEGVSGGYKMSENDMKIGTLVTRYVAVVTIVTVLGASNPGLFAFGGSSSLIEFMQHSKIFSDSALLAGESESTAMQAEMYTCMSLSAATMIASVIAVICPVFMASQAAAGVNQTMNATAKLLKLLMDLLMKFLTESIKMSQKAATITAKTIVILLNALPQVVLTTGTLGVQAAETRISIDLHNLMADIKLIEARLESEIENKDALIANLKKVIQKLLESMEGAVKEIANISNLLQKNREGLSEVLTNLYG